MALIIIIIVIGLIQLGIFCGMTIPGISKYKNIFNQDSTDWKAIKKEKKTRKVQRTIPGIPIYDEYGNLSYTPDKVVTVDEEYYEDLPASRIEVKNCSTTLQTIIVAINRYLRENAQRTSDFGLLKDIVDRNCDAVEEDARELIPIPLYLGLAGTMLGIAIGVGTLVWGGGLDQLLSSDGSGVSSNSIAPLLKDVALAMICSLVGVLLTTTATLWMRHSNSKVEQRKHEFLSWMQATLLPEMPDNMSSVVQKLAGNLSNFNKAFSKNADKLNQTLEQISEASENNARLLEAVKSLNQVQLRQANLQLYERLTQSTQEIGVLADYLKNCSSYLQHVKALNDKLDASEARMKAIEDMGTYFANEKSQIEHVSRVTLDTIGQTDEAIRKAAKQYGENMQTYFTTMEESTTAQTAKMEKVFSEQQQILAQKASEVSHLVSELKNLQDVKQTMKSLLEAYREQNRLLTAALNRQASNGTPLPVEQPPVRLPKWLVGVSILVALSIVAAVALYCLQSFHIIDL